VNLVFKFHIIKYTLSRKSCDNIFIICSDFYAEIGIFINNLSFIQQVHMSHCGLWGPVTGCAEVVALTVLFVYYFTVQSVGSK